MSGVSTRQQGFFKAERITLTAPNIHVLGGCFKAERPVFSQVMKAFGLGRDGLMHFIPAR